MRSDTTGYVETELPQRSFLRLVLQLGLECSRLLQIEVPTRSVPVDAAISSEHPVQHHRGTQGAPVLDPQDAWKLYGVTRGGVEARHARTASELVLACGDTDLRVFDAWTGSWVAEWRWGAYAGWHVGLRHCFAASAQPLTAASTLPVVAPAPGDRGRAALSACPAPQQPRSIQCLPIEVAVMSTARTS